MQESMLTRRGFVKLVAAAAALVPFGGAMASTASERRVRLLHLHSHEKLELTYWTRGAYKPGALEELNYFFRCHQTGEVAKMDAGVIDLLAQIQRSEGGGNTAEIVSGYRSPEYNEYLRRHGRNVAKHSYHIEGQAIDFSIQGVPNRRLARAAKASAVGGVGFYPRFVHIDTGPVRTW